MNLLFSFFKRYKLITVSFLLFTYQDAVSQYTQPVASKKFPNENLTIPLSNRNTLNGAEANVKIGSGSKSLLITPNSPFQNSILIESKNEATNGGSSTVFLIKDTSNWSFFTNDSLRFLIAGNGKIIAKNQLLVGENSDDRYSTLQVNGNSRLDSAVYIRSILDNNSFVSIHRNIKGILSEPNDSINPYVTTPTAWLVNQNLPGLRIRHPKNVSGKIWNSQSIERDLIIAPYEFGMAIEYNGVVECWVGEWSIHKGVFYNDVEGKGNGFGAVLWVGDDADGGGVRTTARNNSVFGGNIKYGELSVENFGGSAHGDFRFRLPSTETSFHYVYGERGSTNIIAKLNSKGIVIPIVETVSNILNPEKAQVVFDSSSQNFKGYNGIKWLNLEDSKLITGSNVQSANGMTNEFFIAHGQSSTPVYFNVTATSPDAGDIWYVSANDSNLVVHFKVAPKLGVNNLKFNWIVKK
jgi:hypothetical protein